MIPWESNYRRALAELDADQRSMVDAISAAVGQGRASVATFAGAGSGKTKTIVALIAKLLNERIILPGDLLATTFTRAGAAEMRRRIQQLVAPETYNALVGAKCVATFNSFASYALRSEIARGVISKGEAEQIWKTSRGAPALDDVELMRMIIGEPVYWKTFGTNPAPMVRTRGAGGRWGWTVPPAWSPKPSDRIGYSGKFIPGLPIPEGDRAEPPPNVNRQGELVGRIQAPDGLFFGLGLNSELARDYLQMRQLLWTAGYHPRTHSRAEIQAYIDDHGWEAGFPKLADAFYWYEASRLGTGTSEFFDDVFWYSRLGRGARKIVITDENQDSNPVQMRIVDLLCDNGNGVAAYVGDTRQSIYSFQGARPSLMAGLSETRGAKVVNLPNNYRSTRQIVLAGNRIAEGQPWAIGLPSLASGRNADAGIPLAMRVYGPDVMAMAQSVAQDIRAQIDAGAPAGDFAVLCATNVYVEVFEAALVNAGVPALRLGRTASMFDAGAAGEGLLRWLQLINGAAPAETQRTEPVVKGMLRVISGVGVFKVKTPTGWKDVRRRSGLSKDEVDKAATAVITSSDSFQRALGGIRNNFRQNRDMIRMIYTAWIDGIAGISGLPWADQVEALARLCGVSDVTKDRTGEIEVYDDPEEIASIEGTHTDRYDQRVSFYSEDLDATPSDEDDDEDESEDLLGPSEAVQSILSLFRQFESLDALVRFANNMRTTGSIRINRDGGRNEDDNEDDRNAAEVAKHKANRAVISTSHGAKGLEWPNVYVIAPLSQYPGMRGDPAEKRRLLYVAATRAERTLTFVASRQTMTKKPDGMSPWVISCIAPIILEDRLRDRLATLFQESRSRGWSVTTPDWASKDPIDVSLQHAAGTVARLRYVRDLGRGVDPDTGNAGLVPSTRWLLDVGGEITEITEDSVSSRTDVYSHVIETVRAVLTTHEDLGVSEDPVEDAYRDYLRAVRKRPELGEIADMAATPEGAAAIRRTIAERLRGRRLAEVCDEIAVETTTVSIAVDTEITVEVTQPTDPEAPPAMQMGGVGVAVDVGEETSPDAVPAALGSAEPPRRVDAQSRALQWIRPAHIPIPRGSTITRLHLIVGVPVVEGESARIPMASMGPPLAAATAAGALFLVRLGTFLMVTATGKNGRTIIILRVDGEDAYTEIASFEVADNATATTATDHIRWATVVRDVVIPAVLDAWVGDPIYRAWRGENAMESVAGPVRAAYEAAIGHDIVFPLSAVGGSKTEVEWGTLDAKGVRQAGAVAYRDMSREPPAVVADLLTTMVPDLLQEHQKDRTLRWRSE